MISVEQLIGDLLLRHNCVIVPAFGGFVANQSSAVIDYANGIMLPPKKSLMFNRQLINNDGLLVNELAVANSLNYLDAQGVVSTLVNDWTEKLRKGERIVLDCVGHLYYDSERNICFEQDRFFNLLLESYGLGKVQFITEKEVRTAMDLGQKEILSEEGTIKVIDFRQVNEIENKEEIIIPHPTLKKHTKIWRYVAAACMLPIAFYSFWIPMHSDVLESGMLSIKDFNPFYSSAEGVYKPIEKVYEKMPERIETLEEMIAKLPADVSVISYAFDDDLFIPVRIKEEQVTLNILPETSSNTVASSDYHFIVGCFSSEVNAVNLVNKLKANGFNASIAGEANGLTRVSAGSAISSDELQSTITKASASGYTGWVLKK